MTIATFNDPATIEHFRSDRQITNFMHLIWLSRPDLQLAFDISSPEGQAGYFHWVDNSVEREYGIEPVFRLNQETVDRRGLSFWRRVAALFGGTNARAPMSPLPGANLIGYAEGVLGMGEHVRMTAETLAHTSTPFGIVDVDPGPYHKRQGIAAGYPMIDRNEYRANIFHVNADQMLNAFCKLGPEFFQGRYNIGFWAWELSKCPSAWLPVIEMVDEIWAPSRFIRDAFSSVTEKPVIFMPLCVELPPISVRPRSHFSLPEDHCLFLYTFDFLSYIDRKNPFAAIRAFKQAFPDRTTNAGLVLKVMKGDPTTPKWQEMIGLIDGDPRIFVINEVMSRNDVLALLDCCDCFVSLHRSEGFGRGPAEAMYLGKPVIVTGYSGNMDFTREGTSLLVDFKLIPVRPDEYVFGEGQVWADVDVSSAAQQMRRVFDGGPGIADIAKEGQRVIREEFSFEAIGRRMTERLAGIGAL